MRNVISALLLSACASGAIAASTPKEDLLVPPANARHFTISSTAAKSGDVWSWSLPNGSTAYRMSLNLRGWITETDEVITRGPDGRPVKIAIRGYTDQGDATENFSVGPNGVATWKTSVDSGSAPFGAKRYNTYGGPWLAGEQDIEALVAAGDKGIDLLPGGHASITIGDSYQVDGPAGAEDGQAGFREGVWLFAASRSGWTPTITCSASPGSFRCFRPAMRPRDRS